MVGVLLFRWISDESLLSSCSIGSSSLNSIMPELQSEPRAGRQGWQSVSTGTNKNCEGKNYFFIIQNFPVLYSSSIMKPWNIVSNVVTGASPWRWWAVWWEDFCSGENQLNIATLDHVFFQSRQNFGFGRGQLPFGQGEDGTEQQVQTWRKKYLFHYH